jgi:hypothetical protein
MRAERFDFPNTVKAWTFTNYYSNSASQQKSVTQVGVGSFTSFFQTSRTPTLRICPRSSGMYTRLTFSVAAESSLDHADRRLKRDRHQGKLVLREIAIKPSLSGEGEIAQRR